jgi:hypothetical protein
MENNPLNQNRNNPAERILGQYWEERFLDIIISLGYSGDSETHGIKDDKIIWGPNGEAIYIQIRHKDSYYDKELRHCYGYERYRLDNDIKIIKEKQMIGLYVIHDYTHWGKDSRINREEDWYAADILTLASSIDLEKDGPTWYGGVMNFKKICYWQLPKFPPLKINLDSIMNS